MTNDFNLLTDIIIPLYLIDEEGDVDESIADYLSDTYGFCVNSFSFEKREEDYLCYDIDWDTSD